MNKKTIIGSMTGILLIIIVALIIFTHNKTPKTNEFTGTVMKYEEGLITIVDADEATYTCKMDSAKFHLGDEITIEYTGILGKDLDVEDCQVVDYTITNNEDELDSKNITSDRGIFKDFYTQAMNKMKTMTLDEKIGQVILARFPDDNPVDDVKNYHLGGFVFYEKDFKNKSVSDVKKMINEVQDASKIPLLTAVDEEGGKVVRISSNPNLVATKFASPSELYNNGGFDSIREDTKNKSKVLRNLGLNLNLAPVIDVSTDPNDYMYNRALQKGTALTSTYATTVIEASKNSGVSYTLKHFPGYGNNADTHLGSQTDDRSYESILDNDIPPFKKGIDAGAEAVLVGHNIVKSIDSSNPASLSVRIHNILKNDLEFTGVIITDDIAMGATSNIQKSVIKALNAGNDLVITTDYKNDINLIKEALKDGSLQEEVLDNHVFKVLSWKYYKYLISNNEK